MVSRASFSSETNSVSMASPTKTHTQTPISINAAGQLPHKLTGPSFPSWSATLSSLLLGYDLNEFLDGTYPCPPKPTHPIEDANIVAYSKWFWQDQLILNVILAFVIESITPLIASAKTSRDAWIRLNLLYANKSRSRVMQLKEHLTLLQRGDWPIVAYL
ncbi:hypothetical protein F2P56_032866 [Juglans regia]|uniref:Uncharacterized protein LOC108989676 n=2 Tax=Juglans regia TaxID=51240 RepID=A0A2I4EHP4_JUGRE|nr:uncharacterized protein LOC108989676 [Juglans regia]KAF5447306.1 hypothetical protein F2P56_032866 [Juglans regia]